MISSIDTYVYEGIQSRLNYMLKNEKLVHLALAELDTKAVSHFIKTFVGEKPKKAVDMSYHYPQNKEQLDARIVVQLGSSVVSRESMGNVEGTYNFREQGAKVDSSIVQPHNDDYLKIELTDYIGSLETIPQLDFSETDGVKLEGKNILFNRLHNEDLVGLEVTVYYTATDDNQDETVFGTLTGFTLDETVEVTPISTNIDTLRCLDALLRVILIAMRESKDEQDQYLLQKHSAGELQNIIPEGEGLDRMIFSRPYTLRYTISNNWDYDYRTMIKQINLKHKGGKRDDGK